MPIGKISLHLNFWIDINRIVMIKSHEWSRISTNVRKLRLFSNHENWDLINHMMVEWTRVEIPSLSLQSNMVAISIGIY